VADISYRPAGLGDAADVFELLQQVAGEIPVMLDTLAREEAMYARVRNWVRTGESRVAADDQGRIVGFVLAELNQTSRFWGEHEVIDVHYAGVAAGRRGKGIFAAMMGQILRRLVPVTVRVNPVNRFDMPRRLQRLGFRPANPGGAEPQFLWEPG